MARHPVERLTPIVRTHFQKCAHLPLPHACNNHPADEGPREFPPRLHTHVSFIFVEAPIAFAHSSESFYVFLLVVSPLLCGRYCAGVISQLYEPSSL